MLRTRDAYGVVRYAQPMNEPLTAQEKAQQKFIKIFTIFVVCFVVVISIIVFTGVWFVSNFMSSTTLLETTSTPRPAGVRWISIIQVVIFLIVVLFFAYKYWTTKKSYGPEENVLEFRDEGTEIEYNGRRIALNDLTDVYWQEGNAGRVTSGTGLGTVNRSLMLRYKDGHEEPIFTPFFKNPHKVNKSLTFLRSEEEQRRTIETLDMVDDLQVLLRSAVQRGRFKLPDADKPLEEQSHI